MKIKLLSLLLIAVVNTTMFAQEEIFADYFDVKTNASSGTKVTGKIHLKSNKDVLEKVIPSGYNFELISDPSGIFELNSIREDLYKMKGLLVGELVVKSGKNTPSTPQDIQLTIALKNGTSTLLTKVVEVKVVTKTMLDHFIDFYKKETIANSRLYGRTKLTDSQIANYITESNNNDGQLKSINDVYNKSPENVATLEADLEEVIGVLGAFGFAYQDTNSSYYQSPLLKTTIYKTTKAYMDYFPVFGDDIAVPYGSEIGDGYQGLYESGKHLSFSNVTHQWETTDALGAPLVQVSDLMFEEIANGDSEAIALQASIHRFYQAFLSIVPSRRAMDNPDQRWGNISDVNYSNGAWADANIGHRMRSLMAMTVLWGDYNRPMTYVPYWYDDYYNGTQFEGLTFAKGWTPKGVLNDLRYWCSKLSDGAKLFDQSGFHVDGTVTHHTGHGASDVAMWAYGFEWMTELNVAIEFFKETPVPIVNEQYQFLADRFVYPYSRMVYKQHMDYIVTGRSFFGDMNSFVIKNFKRDVDALIAGKSPTTIIENEADLVALNTAFQNNTHQHSESVAFWNADYLVHRYEDDRKNYFFSVKQESKRTSGAEDFSSVRKSWHAGSGVLQLRVDGEEYSNDVLRSYDWHMLPGITEEWRSDAMPTGRASEAGPGLNEFSGVLANGENGMAAFHYNPTPAVSDNTGNKLDQLAQYASASAYKSYHMIGNTATAIGSKIVRKDAGNNEKIYTCIDQSLHDKILYYKIGDGPMVSLSPNVSHNIELDINAPTLMFHHRKMYLIFPTEENQKLTIVSGSNINVTESSSIESRNYVIALSHGNNPTTENLDSYHYVMVGDVSYSNMEAVMEDYQNNFRAYRSGADYHGVYDTLSKVLEVSFFKAATVSLENDDWIKVDAPCLVIREEFDEEIKFSLTDALHDLSRKSITVEVPQYLEAGSYSYTFKGIYDIVGETVDVVQTENGSALTFNLPDTSDAVFYDYREAVLAGAPITVVVPLGDRAYVPNINEEDVLEVYPVPLTNDSRIKLNNQLRVQKIEVYDVLGRVLFEKRFRGDASEEKIGLETLKEAKGLKVLKIYTSGGVFERYLR